MVEKYSKLSEKLSSIAVFLGKTESEKKTTIQEKDRLVYRIQQLELELRNNLQAGDSLIAQNTEYRIDIFMAVEKMVQFEELMTQIESDKNDLFEKLNILEEENEQHLKEKHALKVELIQAQTAQADLDAQLKKATEHINVLESLNTYKDDELKEIGDVKKDAQTTKAQFDQSKKTLVELRQEIDSLQSSKQKLREDNIQLTQDLKKEKDYSEVIKKELKDIKSKYEGQLQSRKTDLGISNLAASRMYTYYNMRESINNRLSNMNMPVSFAATDSNRVSKGPGITTGEIRQSVVPNRESSAGGGVGRASLRNSVMMSRFFVYVSQR